MGGAVGVAFEVAEEEDEYGNREPESQAKKDEGRADHVRSFR